MYIPYPQFEYRLSLFYLNSCLLSHLHHLHPTLPSLIYLLKYRTISIIVGATSKLKPKSVQILPSPITTDISGHHRHRRSKSDLRSGTTLTPTAFVIPNPHFENLNESNYNEWQYLVAILLVEKDLWDVVDGSKTCPAGSDNSKSKLLLRSNSWHVSKSSSTLINLSLLILNIMTLRMFGIALNRYITPMVSPPNLHCITGSFT